jgi:hypothetical protein
MPKRNITKRRRDRKKGGAATVFPLKYFDSQAKAPDAEPGRDLLQSIAPLGIRQRIGGAKRSIKRKRILKRSKTLKGGFVPSVMGNFIAAASKYIVPIALFAGYKLMTRKQKKRKMSRRH